MCATDGCWSGARKLPSQFSPPDHDFATRSAERASSQNPSAPWCRPLIFFASPRKKFIGPGSRFAHACANIAAPVSTHPEVKQFTSSAAQTQKPPQGGFCVFARLMGADPTASPVTGECSTVELQPQILTNTTGYRVLRLFSNQHATSVHKGTNSNKHVGDKPQYIRERNEGFSVHNPI